MIDETTVKDCFVTIQNNGIIRDKKGLLIGKLLNYVKFETLKPDVDLSDAYIGAREEALIWKNRALQAEAELYAIKGYK